MSLFHRNVDKLEGRYGRISLGLCGLCFSGCALLFNVRQGNKQEKRVRVWDNTPTSFLAKTIEQIHLQGY